MRETLVAAALTVEAWSATGRRPEDEQWGLYQIVVGGVVVGDVGFHGPPADTAPRAVEIGYAVVPDWRGRGVGRQACAALLDVAWRGGVDLVVAEAAPGNVASRRVLLANGFRLGPDGSFIRARPGST